MLDIATLKVWSVTGSMDADADLSSRLEQPVEEMLMISVALSLLHLALNYVIYSSIVKMLRSDIYETLHESRICQHVINFAF